MIGKKSIGRLIGACYAAVFGTFIMVGIHDYLPDMSIGVFRLLSSAVFAAFYFAGRWIAVRKEQDKKLPTSSKELRGKTKEFYDWLDSRTPSIPTIIPDHVSGELRGPLAYRLLRKVSISLIDRESRQFSSRSFATFVSDEKRTLA
jgi:hypothetical protein